MTDARTLEEEIQYWSVLIQQHKDASKPGAPRSRKSENSSKYSWKKASESNNRISTETVVNGSTNLQNARGRRKDFSLALPNHSRNPGVVVKRSKASFDSKFKWNKNVPADIALHKSSAKVSKLGNIHASKIIQKEHSVPEKTTANPKNAGVKFDSKFKWTKNSTPNLKPGATVKATLANPKLSTGQKNISSVAYLQANSHKYASDIATTSPMNRQNVHRAYSSYKVDKTKLVHAVKNPQHKPSHNAMKWYRHQRPKWSSKRLVTRHRPNYPMNRRPLNNKSANPYRLVHATRFSPKPQTRMAVRPSKQMRGQSFIRRNNRVLDRRQIKCSVIHKDSVNAGTEGVHIHRHSPTIKQVLASRALSRSHQAATARFRKDNKERQHCLYFGRFGKCMRGNSCKFIHDPSRVAVCTRFLRGTCRKENCSFSHKLEKEKTPVCLFFIRGKCTATSCPYLHVYLGKNASVCRKFAIDGFCSEADQCKALHIKCCPEYYDSGSCSAEEDCKLPHLTRKTHSTKTEKELQQRKNETEKSKADNLQHGPSTSSEPSTSATPDFLSLKVDSPQPLNKPFKEKVMHIKPRFVMLKLKNQSSS